jgi:exosortase E/protease (VPEID-CTERM system)
MTSQSHEAALPAAVLLPASTAPAPKPASLPIRRWLCLGVLLLIEIFSLSLRFDTESLRGLDLWWAELLRHAHVLPQVAIAIAGATFLVGGGRLKVEMRHAVQAGAELPWWPFLVAHFAALGGLVWLSAYLLEGSARQSSAGGVWALAWFAAAALTLLLLIAAAIPATRWLPLARRAAGPLLACLVIGLAAWGMGQLTDVLWLSLSQSTFWLVDHLLHVVTADVVSYPESFVIGTSTFSVTIAPECSGYEGIGLVLVFAGVYLWCARRELRFPAALLLLPAATVLIWLLNACRIAGLVAVGTWLSKDAAVQGFHSQMGWLGFNAVALGLVFAADRLPWFHRQAESTSREGRANAAAPFLAPLFVLLATIMITGAFVSGFDWAYPLRVVTTGAALLCFRHTYTAILRWSWSWTAVAIGVGVFVLWLVLEPTAPASGNSSFETALHGMPHGWAAVWLIFRVVGTVITVPLAEELAFRGFLTRQLISGDFKSVPMGRFTWQSFLISSLLFGLLHGRWLAGTLAGMAFALSFYRRRRLGDAVIAHALTNLLLAIYVLATSAWWLW